MAVAYSSTRDPTVESLFWIAFATLVWCYAAYPLFVAGLSLLRPRPHRVASGASEPTVSVVLAVRNGEGYLAERLQNLLSLSYPADRMEVIVVCNGCTDRSVEVAQQASLLDPRIRVLTSPAEQGKAGAINVGVQSATGEFVAFADVRQTFAPDALHRLLEPFGDPGVGAVTGRLVIRRADSAAVEGVRWYWGYETMLRLAEGRTGSVVGATGAIYAMRRELFIPLPPNLILDDVYLPVRIAMRRWRVVMAAEALAFDSPSPDRRLEYHRKRRTMVGNIQLVRELPELLSPRSNPIFVRYLSHKILRLATPFCLIAMFLSAGALPGAFYQGVFLGAALLYAVGGIGLLVPLPLSSIASAVVLMHAAIFSAFWQFRSDAGSVWVPSSSHPTSRPQLPPLQISSPHPDPAAAGHVLDGVP